MSSESDNPIVELRDARSSTTPAERVAALAEVLAAFAAVHLAYRSFKHFTELGRAETTGELNFSPGVVMVLFTIIVLLVCRRIFGAYGFAIVEWRNNLNIGIIWGVAFVAVAGLVIRLAGIDFDPLHPPDLKKSILTTLGELINASLLLWFLARERILIRRIPMAISLSILVVLLIVPIVLAWQFERPPIHMLGTVVWNFFCAGFGEEIFFRGYIQSRMNQTFGRPWRLWGAEFGFGLIVSSALFGFVHVLNTVDYFGGHCDFAWLWFLPNFAAGLFFGLLREKTNSILAGSIIHGLSDVYARVPGLLP
jgi:uncharacterized protein